MEKLPRSGTGYAEKARADRPRPYYELVGEPYAQGDGTKWRWRRRFFRVPYNQEEAPRLSVLGWANQVQRRAAALAQRGPLHGVHENNPSEDHECDEQDRDQQARRNAAYQGFHGR